MSAICSKCQWELDYDGNCIACKLDQVTDLLSRADKVIIWESAAPALGRGFQEEVERALATEEE